MFVSRLGCIGLLVTRAAMTNPSSDSHPRLDRTT